MVSYMIGLVTRMSNRMNALFSALADPTRRAVIERLVEGPASVTELHAPFNIALPTFLRHLRVLEHAGLVRSAKKGRVRMVHVDVAPLAEAERWLSRQCHLSEGRTGRLGILADELRGDEQ